MIPVIIAPGGSVGIPQNSLTQGRPNRVRLAHPLPAYLLEGWVAYADAFPKRRYWMLDIIPAGQVIELRPALTHARMAKRVAESTP